MDAILSIHELNGHQLPNSYVELKCTHSRTLDPLSAALIDQLGGPGDDSETSVGDSNAGDTFFEHRKRGADFGSGALSPDRSLISC